MAKVGFHSSKYLRDRHSLPEELLKSLAVVETLAAQAAG